MFYEGFLFKNNGFFDIYDELLLNFGDYIIFLNNIYDEDAFFNKLFVDND